MKSIVFISLATFLGTWLAAHLAYAFVMMDWSTFTEWHPASRAVILILSVWLAPTVAGLYQLGAKR